jgi:hypothetical protein
VSDPPGGQEELGNGPEDESPWSRQLRLPDWARSGWARALAGVVVAGVLLVALWQAGGLGSAASKPAPSTRPSAAAEPAGPAEAQPSLLPQDFVAVGEICPPVTDGSHTLVVSFTLKNISSVPVTVRSVQPLLPLRGLDAVSTDIAGGTCAQTTGAPANLVLPVGDNLVVTFRFLLPDTCPKPYPIEAKTQVLVAPVGGSPQPSGAPALSLHESDVGVFDDLGAIHFDTCPPSVVGQD